MKNLFAFFAVIFIVFVSEAQTAKTYCNPMNLDYGYTPIPNFSTGGKASGPQLIR
jgi:xylan 1,4-beta-xylosidase